MMNVLAGSRSKLLVDMTNVSFLSSMGIRSLLTVAKTISRRGGKVVLLQPNALVTKVLLTTGTQTMLPGARRPGAGPGAAERLAPLRVAARRTTPGDFVEIRTPAAFR